MTLEEQITKYYGYKNLQIEELKTFANYAIAVTTIDKKFVLYTPCRYASRAAISFVVSSCGT